MNIRDLAVETNDVLKLLKLHSKTSKIKEPHVSEKQRRDCLRRDLF